MCPNGRSNFLLITNNLSIEKAKLLSSNSSCLINGCRRIGCTHVSLCHMVAQKKPISTINVGINSILVIDFGYQVSKTIFFYLQQYGAQAKQNSPKRSQTTHIAFDGVHFIE